MGKVRSPGLKKGKKICLGASQAAVAEGDTICKCRALPFQGVGKSREKATCTGAHGALLSWLERTTAIKCAVTTHSCAAGHL